MRLLDTEACRTTQFLGEVPPYAILSHTWSQEYPEVTLRDLDREDRAELKGWVKIQRACNLAAENGWKWIWIDTCCIDKTDSSELSEAINSMFRWYEEAQICYAYLEDVPASTSATDISNDDQPFNHYFLPSGFPWKWYVRSSRWFTRGWTLQELLAPAFLVLVDGGWTIIGSREAWTDEICKATALEPKHLLNFRDCSLATKMSWAVNRRTTREEDRAYSLLGLLGVHMPLIYGEGKKAFVRLQHELMRNYNDESLLAWGRADGM
jgi:hypothetical protein